MISNSFEFYKEVIFQLYRWIKKTFDLFAFQWTKSSDEINLLWSWDVIYAWVVMLYAIYPKLK